MYGSLHGSGKAGLGTLSAAIVLALGTANAQAQGNACNTPAGAHNPHCQQSQEKVNMNRLGHTDLQGRPSYQPNVIKYPDGRWYLFVGQHSGVPNGRVTNCPANTLPNPLKGNACENNGTMIIDVTDPKNPVEKALIPAPPGGQAQMARMCLGSELPQGTPGKVYLQRNVQGGANSGYQVWDVTNPSAPVMTSELLSIRSTHKQWWECSTGLTFAPGSKNAAPLWRQAQSMLVLDWKNPNAAPVYIRTFGLPGGQPGSTGAVATSLHGPISAYEHPKKGQALAAWTNAGVAPGDNVVGNRIYAAWGVGDNGVMTIIDRKKLLPAAYGGTWNGANPDAPTEAELVGPNSPTVGYYLMSPDQGGHTSFPIFGMQPPSYANSMSSERAISCCSPPKRRRTGRRPLRRGAALELRRRRDRGKLDDGAAGHPRAT
jgi:hypothetical protein